MIPKDCLLYSQISSLSSLYVRDFVLQQMCGVQWPPKKTLCIGSKIGGFHHVPGGEPCRKQRIMIVGVRRDSDTSRTWPTKSSEQDSLRLTETKAWVFKGLHQVLYIVLTVCETTNRRRGYISVTFLSTPGTLFLLQENKAKYNKAKYIK